MANTVASRKQKGMRAQHEVRDMLIKHLKDRNITEKDIISVPSGVPGEDLLLSETATKEFPYSIEIKNVEKLNIWKSLEQATGRSNTPLLIFKRNRSKIYCCLEFSDFLAAIKDKK